MCSLLTLLYFSQVYSILFIFERIFVFLVLSFFSFRLDPHVFLILSLLSLSDKHTRRKIRHKFVSTIQSFKYEADRIGRGTEQQQQVCAASAETSAR